MSAADHQLVAAVDFGSYIVLYRDSNLLPSQMSFASDGFGYGFCGCHSFGLSVPYLSRMKILN